MDEALMRTVRVAIYASLVETGTAPPAAAVARAHGLGDEDVEHAYRALSDGHVIVLEPGTLNVQWAPPFSVPPTPFRSSTGSASWYAPCAWDAFGIPAALKRDADVEARCAWSEEPMDCGVRNGDVYGYGVMHLLVPAAHFWDNIFYT